MATTEAPPFTEADIAALLDVLGRDGIPCNAKHGSPNWSKECSGEVTHRARTTCSFTIYNICLNEARYLQRCFKSSIVCGECSRPLRLCWKLNPI
jgi:hypothetical protein